MKTMDFVRRVATPPARLGILPGTFNPITIAHLALARAARSLCDEVLFVLPRVLPHKEYSGASFEERIEMLGAALGGPEPFSLAVSDAGLFIDIARECRQAYGPEVRLTFLCGRDAAERIAGWDYGAAGAFSSMLRQFDILVAGRNGNFVPPPGASARIERLQLEAEVDHVSASEVRQRLERGQPWEHLVPDAVRPRVRQIYSRRRSRED